METLEGRFVVSALLIVGMMAAIGIISTWKSKKVERLQILILTSATAFLLFILGGNFAIERPYYPTSIALNISMSLIFLLAVAYIFKFFTEGRIFVRGVAGLIFRIIMLGFSYLIFTSLMYFGLVFLFKDIVNPRSVTLNPQLYGVGLPVAVFLSLFFYRLKKYLKSTGFQFVAEIFRDFIFFSFSVYFLKYVILASGAGSVDQATISLADVTILGVYVAVLGIFLEGMILIMLKTLEKYTGNRSIDSLVTMFTRPFLVQLDEEQQILDKFVRERKNITQADRFLSKLNKKFSLKIQGRTFKGSWMFTIMIIVLLVGAMYVSFAGVKYTAEIPAYKVSLKMLDGSSLRPDFQKISSEKMELVRPGNSFILPMVRVETTNKSFVAPLTDRYSMLNSSNYQVSYTGQYFQVSIERVYVLTNLASPLYSSHPFNQTGNSEFDYRGLFRDAEIYYTLWRHNYSNIMTLSLFIPSATILTVEKYIYALGDGGENALVQITMRSESVPEEDSTLVITRNYQITSDLMFLFDQSKVPTVLTFANAEPNTFFRPYGGAPHL